MPPARSSDPAVPVRALLIDDGAHLRYALRALLETDGDWNVVGEAANGVQGRQLAADLRPDVIVLDHQMPVQTGMEALPELRRLCPDATIVVWTNSPHLAEQAQELGADALIDKARPLEDLKDALRELREAA